MKRTYIFVLSLIMMTVLTVGCGNKSQQKADKVKSVKLTMARDAKELTPMYFTGKTKAAEEIYAAFMVSGKIERMLVNEGDFVKKGQMIAVMDQRDYAVQLRATEAEYAQIKADAERVTALYKEGNTTAQNYDKARYGLEQITQKLANHRNQLSDTQLRAQKAGYIKSRLHEAGEVVSAGMPIVAISSNDRLEVEINLPANDYTALDSYGEFWCKFSVTGDTEYPLEVSSVSHEANATQLYSVRLRIKQGCDISKITPGMTTMVYANPQNDASGNIIIPTSAVIGNDKDAKVYVFNVSDSTVTSRSVKVSFINPDGTMTITAGLKAGERVVSSGARFMRDGQKVEVIPEPSKTNVGNLL